MLAAESILAYRSESSSAEAGAAAPNPVRRGVDSKGPPETGFDPASVVVEQTVVEVNELSVRDSPPAERPLDFDVVVVVPVKIIAVSLEMTRPLSMIVSSMWRRGNIGSQPTEQRIEVRRRSGPSYPAVRDICVFVSCLSVATVQLLLVVVVFFGGLGRVSERKKDE